MVDVGLKWMGICLVERAWLGSLSMGKSTLGAGLALHVTYWFFLIHVSHIASSVSADVYFSRLWTSDPTNRSSQWVSKLLYPQTQLELKVSDLALPVRLADK